ncbi:MAG: V-type ATP synthase subunit D [Candidatus Ranarchaeia archaeon]
MSELIQGTRTTRMELLQLRKRFKLAERGHSLLKEKQDALIMEFFNILEDAKKIRIETEEILKEAFKKMIIAKIAIGTSRLYEFGKVTPSRYSLDVKTKNVMGIIVPIFTAIISEENEFELSKQIDSHVTLEDARVGFEKALSALIHLGEVEGAIRKLAQEIEKTKRRVNSLNYIVIPRIKNTVKYISLALEERSREDMFRLKRIKSILENKNN